MKAPLRRGTVAVLVVLSAACSGPTSPTTTTTTTTTQTPVTPVTQPVTQPTTPNFPPLSGASRTFVYDHALTSYVGDYTKTSSFVLYDDGAFVLNYVSPPGQFRGGYTLANGVINFAWEGWNINGPWGATGTLNGGSLTVHYNQIMQLSDFEDAAYVTAQ